MSFTQLDNRTVKARIEHQCWWCHETIAPRTPYQKQVNICDGEFGEIKMHMECDAAWKVWYDKQAPHYEEYYDPHDSDDRPCRGGCDYAN